MPPGSELPSTLGGLGWRSRSGSHADDLAAGTVWRPCGSSSEVAPLRAVLLVRPPATVATAAARPDEHLMLDAVDPSAMRRELDAVVDTFRRLGVDVHVAQPPDDAPCNVIFVRDLFLMTPDGAIVGRMASSQRAGEERHASVALAEAGVPITHTVTKAATFEAADSLWLDEQTVVIGTGFRTNLDGAASVGRVLSEQGVEVVQVSLGRGVQHLLGSVVPIDEHLAAIVGNAVTPELRRLLADRGYSVLELDADEEVRSRRAMNLVTLAPGRVLMPAGNPTTRARFEAADVEVFEVAVGEFVKAAGGLGCMTGILWRSG